MSSSRERNDGALGSSCSFPRLRDALRPPTDDDDDPTTRRPTTTQVGDWTGEGVAHLAAYDGLGSWRIDRNGDGVFEDCPSSHDACGLWGNASHLPLAAIWTDNHRAAIGSFVRAASDSPDGRIEWYLDLDGDFIQSSCMIDKCLDESTNYAFDDRNDWPILGRWRHKKL